MHSKFKIFLMQKPTMTCWFEPASSSESPFSDPSAESVSFLFSPVFFLEKSNGNCWSLLSRSLLPVFFLKIPKQNKKHKSDGIKTCRNKTCRLLTEAALSVSQLVSRNWISCVVLHDVTWFSVFTPMMHIIL